MDLPTMSLINTVPIELFHAKKAIVEFIIIPNVTEDTRRSVFGFDPEKFFGTGG
jgi:hypothetical protein